MRRGLDTKVGASEAPRPRMAIRARDGLKEAALDDAFEGIAREEAVGCDSRDRPGAGGAIGLRGLHE